MSYESRTSCAASTHASSLMPFTFRRHCIRRSIFLGSVRRSRHGAIDVAHVLNLHPELDDLELIEAGPFIRAMALVPFAEGQQGGQADEGAMGVAVAPASAAQADEGVGSGADVRSV